MVRANVDCVVAKGSDQLRITSGAVDGKSKSTTQRAKGVVGGAKPQYPIGSEQSGHVLVPFGLRSSSMS
jgi:hypothetical protein